MEVLEDNWAHGLWYVNKGPGGVLKVTIPSSELTGILCDFATPLKEVEVPIFAISTW
jgi:hypothetical protein